MKVSLQRMRDARYMANISKNRKNKVSKIKLALPSVVFYMPEYAVFDLK